jgi:hypothetical protein
MSCIEKRTVKLWFSQYVLLTNVPRPPIIDRRPLFET